jgi:hypothetical protein
MKRTNRSSVSTRLHTPDRCYGGQHPPWLVTGAPLTESMSGDGRDSNSPSPNQRPLPLINMGIEDTSDLEAGSVFGGGSTLAGQGPSGTSPAYQRPPFSYLGLTVILLAAHEQMTPELKESLMRLERFRIEWESFIDGMVKEWKTLNVVSALLLR